MGCSRRDDFTKFYISAEDCPRHSKEFLESQKSVMSKLEYAQEYLAKFLDDLMRVFDAEWIKKVCKLKRPEMIVREFRHYMGVDIARMGDDFGTYEIFKKLKNMIHQVEHIITKKQLTTETERKIIELQKLYKCKEIGLDAGAGTLGVSVMDHLLEVDSTKGVVVALNSRQLVQDRDEKSKIRILNEDMYNNMKALGEKGELLLLDDDEIKLSLASMQFEYLIERGQPTKLRIFGVPHNASDIVEVYFS